MRLAPFATIGLLVVAASTTNAREPDDLRALAANQATTPDEASRLLPPPPGVDHNAVAPLAPGDRAPGSIAMIGLEGALRTVSEREPPAPFSPIDKGEVDDESIAEALLRYAEGLSLLLAGKPQSALVELQAVVKLDPSAAEPWREIAEAQNALGRRAAATSALAQAVRRGLPDRRVFLVLGRDALRGLRTDEALWLLSRARAGRAGQDPSPERIVIDAALAEALDRAGYFSAARELYTAALRASANQAPRELTSRPDLAEFARRRGELWQRSGDLAMRLEQFDAALLDYASASREPSLDVGGLTLRRMYAAVRLGRPAEGALALVEKIKESKGRVEDRELGLIRYLSERTKVGPALAGALRAAFADAEGTPSVQARITRARAAALAFADARTVLQEQLARTPGDTGVAADLLATFGEGDLDARDRALIDIVARNPRSASACTVLMLTDGRGVRASARTLVRRDAPPAQALFAASVLASLGRPREAIALLNVDAGTPLMMSAIQGSLAEIAAGTGEYSLAATALEKLKAIPEEVSRLDRVRALASLQRFDDALAAAGTDDQIRGGGVDGAMTVARVALAAGRASRAAEIVRPFVEADPFDERPAEIYIDALASRGRDDPQPLTEAVRRLREAVPSSRVLRWLGARELVQRGQWDQAQESLLSLAEEDLQSPGGLVELLTDAWLKGGAHVLARGESWCRERLTRSPQSPDLQIALARLIAAQGRGSDAAAFLDTATADFPVPAMRGAREAITAEWLKDEPGAKRLVQDRLSPAPRTIDDSISLADLLLAGEAAADVAPMFARDLPGGVPLTQEQSSRLLRLAGQAAQRDLDLVPKGKTPAFPGLLSLLATRGIEIPPVLMQARVLILCMAEPADMPAIVDAFQKSTPSEALRNDTAARLASRLAESPRPSSSLVLAEALATGLKDPTPEMLYLVVQLMGWHGDAADAKRLLPTLTQGDRAERVLELFMENGDIMPPPPGRASEIVYRAAGIASSRGRDAQAETLYELTLDINPDHAMTCNDYGYFLVERHTRLDKAQTLLERAATLEPGNANVLDSLGWLRYKQGKFKDDAAAGGVEGSGALSLLADAARTSRLDGNPEILDHFGDALWREGRKDEAKTNWQQASQIVRSALDAFNAGAARPSAYVEKLYRAISTRAQDKLDNVKAGREPTLAPTFDEEKK